MTTETRSRARLAALLVLAVALVGCRQDLHDMPRFEPLEGSDMFANGAASRIPPAHTVARGQLNADTEKYTGANDAGEWVAELPIQATATVLERGEERYNIYCTPCHDRTGAGNGMIVQRGFKQPPSYHEERLRMMPVGYFFDVASNGYGQMSGYKAQISVEDRWAIAAHIRVLQRAAYAPYDALGSDDRARVDNAGQASSDDHGDGDSQGDGHGA